MVLLAISPRNFPNYDGTIDLFTQPHTTLKKAFLGHFYCFS